MHGSDPSGDEFVKVVEGKQAKTAGLDRNGGKAGGRAEIRVAKSQIDSSLMENAAIGIGVVDSSGRILTMNKAMGQITGYSLEEIATISPVDFYVDADDRKKLLEIMRRDGVVEYFEVQLRNKAGQPYWASLSSKALKNEGQDAFLTTLLDITERKRAEEELRESELKFRLVTETIEDVFWMSTPGVQKMIYISPAYEKIWGRSLESLYKAPMSFLEVVHSEDRDRLINIYKAYHAQGKPYHCEYRIIPPDGRLRWISERGFPVFNENGSLRCMTGVCTDITDRKQTEKRLQEEKDFANSLVETAQVIVMVLDTEGRIVSFNPYMEEISGYKLAEVQGRDWLKTFLPAQDHRRIRDVFRRAIGDIQTRGCVNPIITKDGREREIEWYDRTLKDAEGTILGVLSIGQDITKRKRSEERYRAIFEQAADSIVLVNAETGEILEFNERACENLGYSHEEFQKLKISDVEVLESAEEVAQHLGKIVQEGKGVFETQQRTKDGRIRDIQVSSRAISIGGRDFVQSIWRDVTERKQAEDERREYQARLKAMASQLSNVQEKQRRQLAVELHDGVTQKLAMTKLRLETMASSFEDTNAAKKIKDVAEQVGGTIESAYSLMLELSNPVLYEVGLRAAVKALLQSHLVKSSGLKCRLVAPGEPMKFEIDVRVALYQAIRELLVNAIKHSQAQEVVIDLQRTRETAIVTIQDDGVGFDPSEVKPPGKEGGFGLFNIRESIGGVGGEFIIESKSGEGTSAIVLIPMSPKRLTDREERRI